MTTPDLSLALEAVITRFRTMVLSVGARHLKGSSDLDELLQEVRIRLWKSQTSSEEISALPTSYIYQTATTAALDMLRRRRRDDTHTPETSEDKLMLVANAEATDHGIQLHDLERRVEGALGHMVPARRIVVRMSLAGYDRREIADRLGWTEGKVRNLLSRGMDDLRHQLNPTSPKNTLT